MTRAGCALLAALVSGCAPETALLLEVDTRAAGSVEQLHVAGYQDDRLVFGPATRPEHTDGPLEPEETLRVLLPPELGGSEVRIQVEGLSAGKVQSTAEARARVARGEEVRVPLQLTAGAALCGDCDGCCDGARCLKPSVAACGGGGVTCFACDPVLADRCSGEGRCQCGDEPACSPLFGADRCAQGECRCGNGNPCPAGSRCDNGVCRCTAESCAGCCSGNECLAGTLRNACGSGGAVCQDCGAQNLTCSQGACTAD